MKKCVICKQEKNLIEFNKKKSSKDNLQPHCKCCSKEKSKFYYKNNSDKHKKEIKIRKIKNQLETKTKLCDFLLKNPCKVCGENDILVLEFDHLCDKEKEISNLICRNASWETIEKEIAKCQVLCSNCHRKKTHKENNSFKYNYCLENSGLKL